MEVYSEDNRRTNSMVDFRASRRSLWDPKTTALANANLVPGTGSPRAAATARTRFFANADATDRERVKMMLIEAPHDLTRKTVAILDTWDCDQATSGNLTMM